MTDDDINAALALVGQAAGVTQRIDGWISTRRLLTADAQISEAIFCLTEARKILDKGLGIRRSVFGNVVDPNLGPDTSTGAADPRNGFTDGPGSTGATSGGQ
jgi:hypothetical protein